MDVEMGTPFDVDPVFEATGPGLAGQVKRTEDGYTVAVLGRAPGRYEIRLRGAIGGRGALVELGEIEVTPDPRRGSWDLFAMIDAAIDEVGAQRDKLC